jgi:hypothetical protein
MSQRLKPSSARMCSFSIHFGMVIPKNVGGFSAGTAPAPAAAPSSSLLVCAAVQCTTYGDGGGGLPLENGTPRAFRPGNGQQAWLPRIGVARARAVVTVRASAGDAKVRRPAAAITRLIVIFLF